MTFQDDWVALKLVDMLNPRRLMWANDFPHSDSTWPWSRELLLGQNAAPDGAAEGVDPHDNAASSTASTEKTPWVAIHGDGSVRQGTFRQMTRIEEDVRERNS